MKDVESFERMMKGKRREGRRQEKNVLPLWELKNLYELGGESNDVP